MRHSSFINSLNVLGSPQSSEIRKSAPIIAQEPPLVMEGSSWVLALINRSDKCFTLIRTKNVNASDWGQWWSMPKTCRTCSLVSADACFQAKAWQQILSTDCNSVAFEIEIATTPDAQGNYFVASYNAVQPKCSFAGGALVFE